MIRYYITDRRQCDVVASIERNLARGVDWIQIREKDMSDRELAVLVRRAVALAQPYSTRILVNSRVDVALACGAHGVHLTSDSPAPSAYWPIVPRGFLIGVSCHDIAETRRAQQEGADFAVYGPVFTPLSKASHLPPAGLTGLADTCRAVAMPVLALGGVTWENAPACMSAGAAGVAGITLFQAA